METSLSYTQRVLTLPSLLSSAKPQLIHSLCIKSTIRFCGFSIKGRPLSVSASAGPSHCEFSSLNSPLEPRSLVGKFLSTVLQNHRQLFHVVVREELKLLADDRDSAAARMVLSSGSDEACLHRRIAEIKENQCQTAIEDVMYMMIYYKFSEIKVHLLPKLSRCIYNGRLEIWPTKDWELESIHDVEFLELIKEHVSISIGLRANCSVTDGWATTKIRQSMLGQLYFTSIVYGYFLRSASLRQHLEQSLYSTQNNLHLSHRNSPQFQEIVSSYGLKNLLFEQVPSIQSIEQGSNKDERKCQNLKEYILSFHPESLRRCGKLRSKEAVNLVESHCSALLGNKVCILHGTDDVILTSFSSLKRLVLEAVAFGCFLWDSEEYIDNVYKLTQV